MTLCPCGKPLEYISAQVQAAVEEAIERYGPDVLMSEKGQTYRIPRHHVACHGVKAGELARSGFPRVDPAEMASWMG